MGLFCLHGWFGDEDTRCTDYFPRIEGGRRRQERAELIRRSRDMSISQDERNAAALKSNLQIPLWMAEETGVFLYNSILHEWAVESDKWAAVEQRIDELKTGDPEITLAELDVALNEEGYGGLPVRGGMPTGGPPKALTRGLIRTALRKLDDVPWGIYCRTGCEDVAKRIQTTIGGEIHTIRPGLPRAQFLGPRDGRWMDWAEHQVVVKDGRVYDALTGPGGLPVDEFKDLWDYADDIVFGF